MSLRLVRLGRMLAVLSLMAGTRLTAQEPQAPRLPTLRETVTFQEWADPDRHLAPPERGESGRTYRGLGTWIGFGMGVALSPLTWEFCKDNETDCTTSQKLMYSGATGALGAFLGYLIGGSIRRD